MDFKHMNEKTLAKIEKGDDVLIERRFKIVKTEIRFILTYNGTVQKKRGHTYEIIRLSKSPVCFIKFEYKTDPDVDEDSIVNNLGKSGNSKFLENIEKNYYENNIFILRENEKVNGILHYIPSFEESIGDYSMSPSSIIYTGCREDNDHFFLRKDFEIWNMDYRESTSAFSERNIRQLIYGEQILFKYKDEILMGIPFKMHVGKENSDTYYTVVSPFIYTGSQLPKKIQFYDINLNQVISQSSQPDYRNAELSIPQLVSRRKIYALENFLNKNLYSTNKKIEIYLNTRFHVFISNNPPNFPKNYDIKIFEIYKSTLCFKFLSFVYNILEFLESQNVDHNQQVQHNFSIESDTIGVYDTVTIRESKYINWNIMDKSDKLYLTILVPETFKISTK